MTMVAPPHSIATRFTRMFQCRYPLILPGMSWISTPPLVAAVCNAGGLGLLATGPLAPDETRAAIREIRRLTDQPFGVGVTLLMPGATENARVALEEQVPVINTSLGKADWIAEGLQRYNGTLLATVTNLQHAQVALRSGGADAIMATGHEAAAHGGDLTTLALIPTLRQGLQTEYPNVPIVAAGGIAHGPGVAAALTVGADAVAMGSRLAVTQESPLGSKQAIIDCANSLKSDKQNLTVYGSNFDGIPARVLATPKAQQLMKQRPWLPTIVYRAFQSAQSLGIPIYKVLPGLLTQFDKMFMVAQLGAATDAIIKATVDGNLDEGVQFIGQGVGLIQDVPLVEDLVQRILADALQATQEANRILHNAGADDDRVLAAASS